MKIYIVVVVGILCGCSRASDHQAAGVSTFDMTGKAGHHVVVSRRWPNETYACAVEDVSANVTIPVSSKDGRTFLIPPSVTVNGKTHDTANDTLLLTCRDAR
jgi:hypothetical protein